MRHDFEEIVLRLVKLPQKEAFVTSRWATSAKTPVIVELRGKGIEGFGESAVPAFPFYNHEFPHSVLTVLKDFLIPLFVESKPETPQKTASLLRRVAGNPFARAGLEMAHYDWEAKRQGISLSKLLGGSAPSVPIGISLGRQPTPAEMLRRVEQAINKNYARIKLKFGQEDSLDLLADIRRSFPHCVLTVDANSAFTKSHEAFLRGMDQFDLEYIEQPYRDGDLYDHSVLQAKITTALCLDESISVLEDAEAAHALKSCRIINIKPGRVGGLSEAVRIHDFCKTVGVPVWCGGMLESGIGRAANLALASLPGFTLANDIAESGRHFSDDIISDDLSLSPTGMMAVPTAAGIGVTVDREKLKKYTLAEERIRCA